jgi:hypothetical protein
LEVREDDRALPSNNGAPRSSQSTASTLRKPINWGGKFSNPELEIISHFFMFNERPSLLDFSLIKSKSRARVDASPPAVRSSR